MEGMKCTCMIQNPNLFGFRGEMSTGGGGAGISFGNISIHISTLPWCTPGLSGWCKVRVSTCSGTSGRPTRGTRLQLLSAARAAGSWDGRRTPAGKGS